MSGFFGQGQCQCMLLDLHRPHEAHQRRQWVACICHWVNAVHDASKQHRMCVTRLQPLAECPNCTPAPHKACCHMFTSAPYVRISSCSGCFDSISCHAHSVLHSSHMLLGYLDSSPTPRSTTLVHPSLQLHQPGCLSAESMQCGLIHPLEQHMYWHVLQKHLAITSSQYWLVMLCCWHVLCMSRKIWGNSPVSEVRLQCQMRRRRCNMMRHGCKSCMRKGY